MHTSGASEDYRTSRKSYRSPGSVFLALMAALEGHVRQELSPFPAFHDLTAGGSDCRFACDTVKHFLSLFEGERPFFQIHCTRTGHRAALARYLRKIRADVELVFTGACSDPLNKQVLGLLKPPCTLNTGESHWDMCRVSEWQPAVKPEK